MKGKIEQAGRPAQAGFIQSILLILGALVLL